VRDVVVEIRPYKTRDAFTNLTSSPPTIYLNKHLIDDEEVLEYLILREMIHIKLNMYPPMRNTGGLSYAEKFDSALNFFLPKEKVEEIREKMVKKLIEVKNSVNDLFFLFRGVFRRRLVFRDIPPEGCRGQRRGKRDLSTCRFFLTGLSLQTNYPCEEIPVSLYL
jgi:hypothetical protein